MSTDKIDWRMDPVKCPHCGHPHKVLVPGGLDLPCRVALLRCEGCDQYFEPDPEAIIEDHEPT